MKNTEAVLALSIRQVQRIKKKVARQDTKGLETNNSSFSHPCFRQSLADL